MNLTFTLSTLALLLAGGLTAQGQLRNIEAEENEDNRTVSLSNYYSDPDDASATFSFEIINNRKPDVASAKIMNEELTIDFLSPGQTDLIIKASSSKLTLTDTVAIGVRPIIHGYHTIASFEELNLGSSTFWNGSDMNGGFLSGPAFFNNSYNPDWLSWSGWACSEVNDDSTAGYTNQYAAYSSVRLDSADGKQYGVSYASPSSQLELKDNKDHVIKGFFVSNSTYTALSMKHGDAYTKKFGGPDGSDLDWLNLQIVGYNSNGDSTGTVNFRLADFTFEESKDDYIIETWQWIDLTSLDAVTRLNFSMSSTDNGDWGMNTPAYFCMDNLHVAYLTSTQEIQADNLLLYPNPSKGQFGISFENGESLNVHVYTISGIEVATINEYRQGEMISLDDHAPGTYIIRIESASETRVERLIIQ